MTALLSFSLASHYNGSFHFCNQMIFLHGSRDCRWRQYRLKLKTVKKHQIFPTFYLQPPTVFIENLTYIPHSHTPFSFANFRRPCPISKKGEKVPSILSFLKLWVKFQFSRISINQTIVIASDSQQNIINFI